MDFYKILLKVKKDGTVQVYPDWQVNKCEDLMIQGSKFYAFWDENRGLWSRDEFRLRQLVDADLYSYAKTELESGVPYEVLTTQSFSTGMWKAFQDFVRNMPDNSHPLDTNLTFADTEVKKSDFVSKRLPYSLAEGKIDAWNELISVLYSPDERDKIEWAIGAILSGDSKWIQKFLVLYGPPASGKSTVLNIIQKLFEGYTTSFDAAALGQSGSTFATDIFKHNPLVAIQHDGDLSRIADNTKLNSITAHEEMTMNEKYKPSYTARVNAFLFMGTNKPVKITDAKAGTIRRLIDVHPTGARLAPERYHILINQIDFEIGAIAHHCLNKYRAMGKHYYNGYKPIQMMYQTDEFYNFVSAHYDIFKAQNGVTLRQAWTLYKEYCEEVNIKKLMNYHSFREELSMYFDEFEERVKVGDEWVRSYYSGFKGVPTSTPFIPDKAYTIELHKATAIFGDTPSAFDRMYHKQPAQYPKEDGTPEKSWRYVDTCLEDLDATKLHFVQVPEEHIVIDFDLVDEDGNKSIERNLEEASKWPPTYAELSKSGAGVHLHYIYEGLEPVDQLAQIFDVGIEVKTLLGNSSLRRKLTKCNNLDVASIRGGLPLKEKPMIEHKQIQSEKGLRDLINRNLRKEIHSGTKPSVDFIHSILEDTYASGLSYDITDMRPQILAFAAGSTHQAQTCIKMVQQMKFLSDDRMKPPSELDDKPFVFYDVEVYPNLFMVCWKYHKSDTVVRMINPTPEEIEGLFSMKLIGFNNRRYDNHMLYARYLGESTEQIFRRSDQVVNHNNTNVLFGEAYNLSYADIYDFSSKKQGLKKFMIELGISHMELDIPWDKPVPESLWGKVEEYCVNDVLGTEKVFEDRMQDFVARELLADLSGLTVNHTTRAHATKIIFGDVKDTQGSLVYTDLSKQFEGYTFDGRESTYRGEVVGEGGYVYAEPGLYENVALLDVASMHPTSILNLNLFGKYTDRFRDLIAARLAIKHGDFERARSDEILGGKLAKHLGADEVNREDAEALSYALKIVINSVYGYTSATFDNPFRDNRNKDNIVAKRGALFMIDLKYAVQERGYQVVHIKTDSIKVVIPKDAPKGGQEIIDFIFAFGLEYGYDFEHEATYDRFGLVNDAVYIARYDDKWTAVGKQFQHPYVFKTMFTHESPTFDDFCETRNVTQGTMYLDTVGDGDISQMVHVGRTGSFVPVRHGGGDLWRVKEVDGELKKWTVTGTKGYKWIDREIARGRNDVDELFIDMDYFENLVAEATNALEQYGDISWFMS